MDEPSLKVNRRPFVTKQVGSLGSNVVLSTYVPVSEVSIKYRLHRNFSFFCCSFFYRSQLSQKLSIRTGFFIADLWVFLLALKCFLNIHGTSENIASYTGSNFLTVLVSVQRPPSVPLLRRGIQATR